MIAVLSMPMVAYSNPPELEKVISWGVDNARKSTGWGLVGYRKDEVDDSSGNKGATGWGLKPTEAVTPINEEKGEKPKELEVVESKNMDDRQQFIMELALSIGAQAGYHYELQRWTKRIKKHSEWLHKNFRIAPLMLKKGTLLPPVLTTSENNVSLSDDAQIIRAAGQVFKIIQQPKFVLTAPTWETYLLSLISESPDKPVPFDLPRSADESLVWEHYVIEGWNQGVKKVEVDFRINIARLRRDIVGMSLYHILLDRGMISEPIITKNEMPVSGDDETLVIDDKNLEIKVVPKMQHNVENWRPIGQVAELFGKGIIE